MTRYLLYGLGLTFALEWKLPHLALGPIDFTTVESLIGLMLVTWVATCVINRRLPHVPDKSIITLLLIWFGVMALSTLFSPASQWNAGLFLMRISAGIFVAWAAFDQLQTSEQRRIMAIMMVCGGVIVAIAGFAELSQNTFVLQTLSRFKSSPTRAGDLIRLSGTLSYATIMAIVLEMVVLISVGLLLEGERRQRLLIGGAVFVMVAAMVLTLSRSSVIGVLAGLLLCGFFGWRWQKHHTLWIAGGVALTTILIVGGVFVLNPNTLLRLQSETESDWYNVSYVSPDELTLQPGEVAEVSIEIVNTGLRTWRPEEGFMLGYHLYDEQGETITYDGARTTLGSDIAPQHEITLDALVIAPQEEGSYTIEWDMVHDQITWFSWKGAETSRTEVTISGEPVENPVGISVVAPPSDIGIVEQVPGRLTLWRVAWLMFLDRPILGVGPDNFRWRYGDYADVDNWNTSIHANNLYLEMLADTGILGFVAFMSFSGMILFTCLKALMKTPNMLLLGCVAALVAWYVHGFVDYFYEFTPTYTLYWMVVGIALGGSNADRI